MKQIPGWQCSDGRCFFNQRDAETHEKMIKVEGWLIEDPSFFHGGLAGIDCAKELIDFLQRNEKSILELMEWERKRTLPKPGQNCDLRPLPSGDAIGGHVCTTCGETFENAITCPLK